MPDAFYSFARVDGTPREESHPRGDGTPRTGEPAVPHPRAVAHPLQARFGDQLELLGYDYTLYNAVHAQQLPVTVTTYWRVLEPLDDGATLALFFSRQDGAIVYHFDGATSTDLWYPTDLWREGEVIQVQTPILSAGRLREVTVAVVPAEGDPWSVKDRLAVDPVAEPVETYERGTLLKLFRFP